MLPQIGALLSLHLITAKFLVRVRILAAQVYNRPFAVFVQSNLQQLRYTSLLCFPLSIKLFEHQQILYLSLGKIFAGD